MNAEIRSLLATIKDAESRGVNVLDISTRRLRWLCELAKERQRLVTLPAPAKGLPVREAVCAGCGRKVGVTKAGKVKPHKFRNAAGYLSDCKRRKAVHR